MKKKKEGLTVDQINRRIGLRLRVVREALGMTGQEFAKVLGIADKSGTSRYEKGETPLNAVKLWRLAVLLHVPPEYILLGQRERIPANLKSIVDKLEEHYQAPPG